MKEIKFGNISIGEGRRVVTIAEVACQHMGNMTFAKRLIDAAKEAGADIAKFQLHLPEHEMVAGTIKFWGGSMDAILKKAKFQTAKEHKELKDYCKKVGIQYLCTPFSREAADVLEQIDVAAYKTGSGELTNLPMLRHIARKKRPMIVSTGMSTLKEITDAVTVLKKEGAHFALTHCLSEYPAQYKNMNLNLIPKLKQRFGVITGLSDHSPEIYSALAGVALGAKIIEKHFTLPDLSGPDDIASVNPDQFKEMVDAIRKIERALGNKKLLGKEERVVRKWAHHSVVASRDISKNEKLSLNNLNAKRPGWGIPSKYLDAMYSKKLIGRGARRALPKEHILQWRDVA